MSDLELSLPLTERSSESLQVFLLGTVEFESALRLQEQFRDDVIQRNDRLGGLFVCEHPPVVTIGREGSQTHLRRDVAELNKLGIDVRGPIGGAARSDRPRSGRDTASTLRRRDSANGRRCPAC